MVTGSLILMVSVKDPKCFSSIRKKAWTEMLLNFSSRTRGHLLREEGCLSFSPLFVEGFLFVLFLCFPGCFLACPCEAYGILVPLY